MDAPRDFLSGVIEGFYGRAWSHETRQAYAHYLSEAGLNTCIYCPKSDPFLRRRWQDPWPLATLQDLQELSRIYRQKGLHWGVGLSPVELYRQYGPTERSQLQHKVEYLADLEMDVLAILFDDMPGDLDALAARQAEIIADVRHWAGSMRILVCPTYYSFDPVLERVFGRMPNDYWQELGRDLSEDVDVFWTGNAVCSERVDVEDIQAINRQLGRRVTLWDNYPVNDGAKRSEYLYTSPLSSRPKALRGLLAGHLCNPMNQGLLSLPALSGLADLYGKGPFNDTALAEFLGSETWKQLRQDRLFFEQFGLPGLDNSRRKQLWDVYARLPGEAAREITQWLAGEYEFDPACLTE